MSPSHTIGAFTDGFEMVSKPPAVPKVSRVLVVGLALVVLLALAGCSAAAPEPAPMATPVPAQTANTDAAVVVETQPSEVADVSTVSEVSPANP